MDHAYSHGITLFDTAAAYAGGASEIIIGRWLASRQPAAASLRVATKIQPPFQAATLGPAVAESRRRLGGRPLDVLFLHRWDETAESDEVLRGLERLVREGHVATLGVSNYSTTQLARLLKRQAELQLTPCQVIQNNHNFAVREVDMPLRHLCAEHKVAIVTYSPLGAGFLTGKHWHGAAAGTRFTLIPGHQKVYFQEQAFRRLAHLQAVANRHGLQPEKLALAWALKEAGAGSVLVGGRSVSHLNQALEALSWEETPIMEELATTD